MSSFDLNDLELAALITRADSACDHQFRLLGDSFHCSPRFGVTPINRANRMRSNQLSGMISESYELIDWQRDFRSGYRWDSSTRSCLIKYGRQEGVDVKIPWELSRLQHLPAFAWAFTNEPDDLWRNEFCNQVIDFIAHNPPRFGVNWACTMDVAIRAVNLLVAFDLLRSTGVQFHRTFREVFVTSIFEHGRHIINNLEWFPELRSNHYLANVCGLLFVAFYLPPNGEIKYWRKLAIQELKKEISSQFQSDGSNFEGSTSYHRLSTEMIDFSLKLLKSVTEKEITGDCSFRHLGPGPRVKLKGKPVDLDNVLAHLETVVLNAYIFLELMTHPDGCVAQLGDNDGGRFIILDANHPLMFAKSKTNFEPALSAFVDFGAWVFNTKNILTIVRCGSIGQNGQGGHAHNDQMSFEASFSGLRFVVDPGTYVYTPHPNWRNRFRGTRYHNVLYVTDQEQNIWEPGMLGLFSITKPARTEVTNTTSDHWNARLITDEYEWERTLEFSDLSLQGADFTDSQRSELNFHLHPSVKVEVSEGHALLERDGVKTNFLCDVGFLECVQSWYSPTYGIKLRTMQLRVSGILGEARWSFVIEA